VLNKVDRMDGVGKSEVGNLAAELGLPSDYVAVSAQRGWGVDALLERIELSLSTLMVPVDALIPYNRNDLLALWHRRGVVETEEYEGEGTHVHGRLPRALVNQFAVFANGKG
jgi:GTP-binding protein HflX